MDIFDGLMLIWGLCLFLFGMNMMGSGLEKRAGGKLKSILAKLTSNKLTGFAVGLLVTSIIQSSSATTVMVVGFVNSGIMTLHQAVGVIMGANVGTTITAWILSLNGIEGSTWFLQLLKPTSFTPVLALLGVVFYMFSKSDKRKDTGTILLGFATLMFGMDAMSGAVAGLKDVPEFANILIMFENPIFGVVAGAALTCVIQSSSASIGILQALSVTGSVTFGTAVPIMLGMDIGTCITAMLSSIGANRNARRAATIHLLFNVIGTAVFLSIFYIIDGIVGFAFMREAIDGFYIAVINSIFKIFCTVLMLPVSNLLVKLEYIIIPEGKADEKTSLLDERLISTTAVALDRCRTVTGMMADDSVGALHTAIGTLSEYSEDIAKTVRAQESSVDEMEDKLGSYLVKVSSQSMSADESTEAATLLHIIGDFERISDHAVNIVESAEEMIDKNIRFSDKAQAELNVLVAAVEEILDLAHKAYKEYDYVSAAKVEPLEQVVDTLVEQLRSRHIQRLQKSECTIELGFVWLDLLTNLERVADHCSNIAGCMIDAAENNMNIHASLRVARNSSEEYMENHREYVKKFSIE